ncbi:MAG: RNA polymerase sigma factor [Bacteroidia bacterium]|nr:MAG: RNA polymerase sigma factor [Bacteroidia bacterium]
MNIAEYNRCVDAYSDRIYRFILVQTSFNKELAKDIVQDCFEKLWLKRETVRFDKARSYLFTAAYHTLIDYIRKEKHNTSLDVLSSDSFQYHPNYSNYDLNHILNEALNQLPHIQKTVLLLRDYEGYEYKEIELLRNSVNFILIS